jgi:hypothetical protein
MNDSRGAEDQSTAVFLTRRVGRFVQDIHRKFSYLRKRRHTKAIAIGSSKWFWCKLEIDDARR